MSWLARRWNSFWFMPTAPDNLAICRILFYGLLFLFYLREDFSSWSSVAQVHWRPMWSFRLLQLSPLSQDLVAWLQIGWKVTLLLTCLGLWTRMTCFISFVLGFYLLGLQHNFSRIVHTDGMLVIVLGILAFARCGDVLSLDAWWRHRRRDGGMEREGPAASGEYTWPIRMIWLAMSIIYFAAGFAKLRHSGLAWIFSDHIANLLIRHNYVGSPWTSWGLNLAQFGWLCQLMAAATIVVEVGFPLAMFSFRLRWILLPTAFLMHAGILLLMGPDFWQFLFCYVFWIPWRELGGRLPWLASPGASTA